MIDIATAMYLMDTRVYMISEIGLPVALQAQVAFTSRMSGAITLKTEPEIGRATLSTNLNKK